jgi:hypothetical protein
MVMTSQAKNVYKVEFELNPFISSIARWLDREVTESCPAFKAIDVGERIARICLELHDHEVATITKVENATVWIPTPTIEGRIGGSSITTNPRLKIAIRVCRSIFSWP